MKPIRLLTLTVTVLLFAAQFEAFAEVVPAANRSNWQDNVGVPGGIPTRTTIYKTFSPGATLSQIQSALTSCPSGQVVYLNAGTYNVSGKFNLPSGSWTLRGAGMGQTILNGAHFNIGQYWDMWSSPSNVTAAASKGATSVTLASSTGFNVGGLVMFEMDNTAEIYGYGAGGTGSQTSNSVSSGRMRDGNRVQHQLCKITAKSGNILTITPPLVFDLPTARNPRAVYHTNPGPQSAGIEDLTVQPNDSTDVAIWWQGAFGCWMKNVELTKWGTFGFEVQYCANMEFRGCYIHDPTLFDWGKGYSIQLDPADSCLVIDNIIYKFQDGILLQGGCSGNVIAYNCLFRSYPQYNGVETLLSGLFGNHTPYPCYNLWEGNFANQFHSDFYYGPSGYGTLLRNCFTGTEPDATQNRICVNIDAMQRHYSVVGNILGTATTPAPFLAKTPNENISYVKSGALSWTLDPGSANFSYTTNVIYRLGYPFIGNNSSGSNLAAHDQQVKTETIRHGNWDASTKTVNWDPTNTDHTMPSSFFLTAKPAWFGDLAWPPFDASNPASGIITNIPAGYRFVYGVNPPSGGGSSDTQNPTVPAGFTSTASGPSQVGLAWTAATDNVGVTGYRIERSEGSGSVTFSQIATPTGTSYSDTGLSAATIYNYRIRSVDAAGNTSAFSTTATATTAAAPDTTAPSVPASVVATATGTTTVSVQWNASTDNIGVTSYRVERSQGSGSTTFTQVGTPTAAPFADTGLTASTVYNYRVRAVDAAGNLSQFSTSATVTTAAAPDQTAPSAPQSVTATASGSAQVNLTWTASTDNVGVTGYRVERSQGSGTAPYTQVATPVGTTFNDAGLTAATIYNYRVRAVDAAGNLSAYSTVATATTGATADTTAPSVPQSAVATAAGTSQINLSWSASTDNVGVAKYEVERSQGSGSSTFTLVSSPTTTTYANQGLTASTVYNFRIRAVDAAGNASGYSTVVTATTAAPADTVAPSTPQAVTATATSGSQVSVAWSASTDNVGVTEYRIERSQGFESSTYTQVGISATPSFSDGGLSGNTIYNYRVRAVDAAGNLSAFSASASATTQNQPTLQGLVAAYSFSEGTGTSVKDASGNKNVGVVADGTWTTGKYGGALQFNGTSSMVTIPASSTLNITAATTQEAWIYPTASTANWYTILHRQTDAYYLHASNPSGAMRPAGGGMLSGTEVYAISDTAIPLNAWTHLAMTYDGTTIRVYINGALAGSHAGTGTIETNTNPLRIGGNVPYGQFFQGKIDEVRIYNRALTPAEITTSMNTSAPIQVDGVHFVP